MFSWMTTLYLCSTLCPHPDPLASAEALLDFLEQLDSQPVSIENTAALASLWAQLEANQQIPFRLG